MDNVFAVLGLGHFGEALAHRLAELGSEVICVDASEEKINNIADDVTYAVTADINDINALRAVGVNNVDIAIVCVTSDINANLMGVLNCQELGIKSIFAKSNSDQHTKVLEKLGVTKVFNPEKDMGRRIADSFYRDVAATFLKELEIDPKNSIVEIDAVKAWIGKSLSELNLSKKYGVTVIAISNDNRMDIAPKATDVIKENDKLLVLGSNDNLDGLNDLIRKKKHFDFFTK